MAELNVPAGVGEGKGPDALASVQEDLDAILKSGPSMDEPVAEPAPAPVAEEAPPEPPMGLAETVGRNVAEIPRAVGSGIVRGYDAVIGLGDMLQEMAPVPGLQLFDMEGNFAPAFVSTEEIARDTKIKNEAGYSAIPNPFDRPETFTGRATEGVAQFLAGFGLAGKALKAAGVGAKSLPFFVRASGQGMFADFAAFDGHEERLSNWLASEGNPEVVRSVGQFLAADPSDSEAEGRLKNVLEGVVTDAAFGGLLTGLKALKQARRVKADMGASTFTDAAKKMEQETLASGRAPMAGKEDPLSSIGSSAPDAPLVIKPDRTVPPVGKAQKAPPPGMLNGAKRVPLEGGDVFINFARINTEDDVKNVIRKMAENSSAEIERAQRGVVSNKATEKAADSRYMDAFEAILSRRRGEGVPPQDVQLAMRRLWASSAEKLMEAAKAVEGNSTAENMLAFRRMVLTHKLIQEQVLAIRTETARALQQWSIPAGAVAKDKIDAINRALDAGGGLDTTVELARQFSAIADDVAANPKNMGKLDQAVEKAAKATTVQAAAEIWKGIGLLSGVKTHIRNIASNTGMIMSAIAERAVAARAAGLLDEKTAVEIGEASKYATGVVHNLRQAWLDAADTFRTGQMKMGSSQLDNNFGAMRSRQLDPKTATGRMFWTLSHAASPVYRFLQASDQMMKTLNYSGEIYAQAWRKAAKEAEAKGMTPEQVKELFVDLVAKPTKEMEDAASAMAERATFTQKPGPKVQWLLRGREKIPALEFIVPFITTPANIFRTSLLSSPMAPLLKQYRESIAKGGSEALIARTRMGIGTSVMLTTMDLALNDKISGSGPDPSTSEYKALLRTGWKPYSVKISDKWVSYQGLEPFTTVIAMGADLGEALKRSGDMADDPGDAVELVMDGMSGAIFGIANNMMERSFMTGLADLMSAVIDPDRAGENYMAKFVSSFTPRVLLDIRQAMDPSVYDARTFVDSVLQKIPGATGGLTQKRDEWGRPVTIDSGLGRFYDIVSPFYVSKSKQEPIDKALIEQGLSLGIRNRTMSVNGVQISIKNRPDIHNRFLELRGATKPSDMGKMGQRLKARYGDNTLLETLNAVVGGNSKLSKFYQRGTDGQDGDKHKLLRKILSDYSKVATTMTLKEFPELLDNAKAKRKERIDRALRGEEMFQTTLSP